LNPKIERTTLNVNSSPIDSVVDTEIFKIAPKSKGIEKKVNNKTTKIEPESSDNQHLKDLFLSLRKEVKNANAMNVDFADLITAKPQKLTTENPIMPDNDTNTQSKHLNIPDSFSIKSDDLN